jgi:hypothetical protein
MTGSDLRARDLVRASTYLVRVLRTYLPEPDLIGRAQCAYIRVISKIGVVNVRRLAPLTFALV